MYSIVFYTPADYRLHLPEEWVFSAVGPPQDCWLMDSNWLNGSGCEHEGMVEFRWAFHNPKHARMMELWCELSDFEVRRLHPDEWVERSNYD